LPLFQFDKALRIARRVKRFLRNPKKVLRRRMRGPKNAVDRRRMRSKKHEFRRVRKETKSQRREEYRQLKNKIAKIENELEGKERETEQVGKDLLAAEDPVERSEHEERRKRIQRERSRLRAELCATKKVMRAANIGRKKMKKGAQQEIFQIERELDAAKGQRAVAGALPDFLIIGEKKCGTSYLYYLLGQHPLVEPAASKELHFFDVHFDEGIEWYRRCFPQPRRKDGRRTITGEATPYMSHPFAPKRVAEVVPEARLIALLRNPVDRAYSDYQQMVRKGRETRTFEEIIGVAKTRSPGEGGKTPNRGDLGDARRRYLSRSVYVDQLLRWSEFFPPEQMLVLKSEDFFENPHQTLKVVFNFLDLPEWEPEASEIRMERKKRDKRNTGVYEEEMDPSTRRRLEEYFEPHNRRLYDYLGVNLGW
jgi:hypothetical protein